VADVNEREALARWRTEAPALVAALCQDWELQVDGSAMAGETASVVPVRTRGGEPAALKVGWPHPEAEHEHLALRTWAGNGAVRLLRADPRRSAMLLERAAPGHDLGRLPVREACEVVAGLYARLHRPAIPQLTRLSQHAARWTTTLAELRKLDVVPRRFVDQAGSLARGFADDPATDGVLLHTDLHYANVLAAQREPWLVIDPKPMAGDPHYEPAPMLWNRWDEVVASGNVRDAVRRRFHTIVDTAGLDEDRARDWVVVREVLNALWTVEDAADEHRGLRARDRSAITAAVTIAKAVQE
jgi:streptomycin 6-kinase